MASLTGEEFKDQKLIYALSAMRNGPATWRSATRQLVSFSRSTALPSPGRAFENLLSLFPRPKPSTSHFRPPERSFHDCVVYPLRSRTISASMIEFRCHAHLSSQISRRNWPLRRRTASTQGRSTLTCGFITFVTCVLRI